LSILMLRSVIGLVGSKEGRMQGRSSVLVVDDEFYVADTLQKLLESENHDVVVVLSGKEAIEACRLRSFNLVISDMRMPGMDGVELFRVLAHDYPLMRRVILTGYMDMEEAINAINLGRVHRYLIKPIKSRDLRTAVSEELKIGEHERSEIVRLRRMIDKLTD
jgi:DNA-binding NtrC family response regulator